MVVTVSLIPVSPTFGPTELDRLLEPWSLEQIEDDEFIAHYIRENVTQRDLQHLQASLFLTEGIADKISEARNATAGQYGVILPLPAQVWVDVTFFQVVGNHQRLHLSGNIAPSPDYAP